MESITSNDNITTTSNISNITITTPLWWKPSPPTSLSRHGAVDKLVQHLFWLWSTGLGSQVQGEGQENIEGSENKTTWQKSMLTTALQLDFKLQHFPVRQLPGPDRSGNFPDRIQLKHCSYCEYYYYEWKLGVDTKSGFIFYFLQNDVERRAFLCEFLSSSATY